MPFTFSHPAAVLYFGKNASRYTSITALIAGAVVPDFEFFFQLKLGENVGHHISGILLLDFPLGLALCFIYHQLVKVPLTNNLPLSLRQRLCQYKNFDWTAYVRRSPLTVFGSLFLGIASHIVWDGFTHFDGLFVKFIPVLSSIITVSTYEIPIYSAMQLFSSIVGIAIVIHFTTNLPKTSIEKDVNSATIWYWVGMVVCTLTIFYVHLTLTNNQNDFWNLVFAMLGSWVYAMMIISGLAYLKIKLASRKNSRFHESVKARRFNPFINSRVGSISED
jgi:Domain of unknown function (DUF4184)